MLLLAVIRIYRKLDNTWERRLLKKKKERTDILTHFVVASRKERRFNPSLAYLEREGRLNATLNQA